MAKNSLFVLADVRQEKELKAEQYDKSNQLGTNKYCLSVKRILKNYRRMKKQTEKFEGLIMQCSAASDDFDLKTLQTAPAEEIAKRIKNSSISSVVQSTKSFSELQAAYLKSKYLLQLVDDALEELETFENGDMQLAVLTEMYINDILRDDLELVLEEKGFPMSKTTAYRVSAQALENMSVLIWGYEAIKDAETEKLFSSEFLNLVNNLAA